MSSIKNVLNCKNGIIGMCIGDALGVPNEGISRIELINCPRTEMSKCEKYSLPKGAWSDNSSLAIATMDAIIDSKTIDTEEIANNYFKWFKNGDYSSYGTPYNIKNTILKSMARFEVKLKSAEECGSTLDTDIDNSVLSRMIPVAYYSYYRNFDTEKIYKLVKKVASITHRQEISVMAAFLFTVYYTEILNRKSKDDAYLFIKNINYSNYFSKDTINHFHYILDGHIATYDLEKINSAGTVIDTLEAVLWVFFNTYSLNSAILGAINIGGDTSTMGALVGGIAGAYYSLSDIKSSWEKDLIKYDGLRTICDEYTKACLEE